MRARVNTRGSSDHGLAPAERIVDEMIDDYVSWREACAAAATAYKNWKYAERHDKTLAFSLYASALDGEERAAAEYQRAFAYVARA
jgi:hypothetical protein